MLFSFVQQKITGKSPFMMCGPSLLLYPPPPPPLRAGRGGGEPLFEPGLNGFFLVRYYYCGLLCRHLFEWQVIGSCNEERSPIPEGHGEEAVGGATYTALSDQKKEEEEALVPWRVRKGFFERLPLLFSVWFLSPSLPICLCLTRLRSLRPQRKP